MSVDDSPAAVIRDIQRSLRLYHSEGGPGKFKLSEKEFLSDVFNRLGYSESYHLVPEVMAMLPESVLPTLRREVERTLAPGAEYFPMIRWSCMDPELRRTHDEKLLPVLQRLAMLFSKHLGPNPTPAEPA